MAKIIILGICVFGLCSCNISKFSNSYKESIYSGKNDSISLVTFTNFINYKKKYNFELIYLLRGTNTISLSAGSIERMTEYVDDGVNLFFFNDSNYFAIDTFALNAKIAKHEMLSKKTKGVQNISTTEKPINTFGYSFPKDTIINNNKLYYIDTTLNNVDSIGQVVLTLFFTKSGKFTSHYYVKNKPFQGYSFSYVGFSQKMVKTNESALLLIEDIKPLTKQQRKICKSLLKKAQKYNTKT
jgi:hypothetical protein